MKAEVVDIEEIQEVIIAFANRDFSRRLTQSENLDARDIIVSGINMLGEELEQTTISRDYFESLFDAISDILIVTDSNLVITDTNDMASEKLGVHKEALKGMQLLAFVKSIPDKDLNQSDNQPGSITFDSDISVNQASTFPASCTISQIYTDGYQGGYLFIAKDITEKIKQENRTLRAIVSAEEKVRHQLAYDLHDSLGQELNAVKMYIDTLDYMDESKEHTEVFNECKDVLDQALQNIRDLSYDLLPKSLENVNLLFALEELCKRLKPLQEIVYDFENEELYIPKDDEKIIFRVFQEFINNSLKHANATKINLKIKKDNHQILFSLSDNGKGFNLSKISAGNGIDNIKSRLNAIKSKFNYYSSPGKGTHLRFVYTNEKD